MSNESPNGKDPAVARDGGRADLPAGPSGGELTLRAALAVLWRRKWIIILAIVVATTSPTTSPRARPSSTRPPPR